MIDTLMLMTGVDIPIPDLQIQVHQPTIKEISMMGEKNFFIALQFLTIKKENYIEDKRILNETTNFQVFMTVINQNPKNFGINIDIKNCVIQLLTLLFDKYKILLTPQSIIFSKDEQTILIDDNNFQILQDIINLIFCLNSNSSQGQAGYNPKNAKAKAIADKIMAGRKKIAEQKGGSDTESLFTRYISVLAIGIPMDFHILINSTMFQLYDLLERFSLYRDWDIDMKVRLAGGDPKTQVESFMKNIH